MSVGTAWIFALQIWSLESQLVPSCVSPDEPNRYEEVGEQYGINVVLLVITLVAASPGAKGIQLPNFGLFWGNLLMGNGCSTAIRKKISTS